MLHRQPNVYDLTLKNTPETSQWYRVEKPPFVIEILHIKGTLSGFVYWGSTTAPILDVYANIEGEIEHASPHPYFTTAERALQFIEKSLEKRIQEVTEGLRFWLSYDFKNQRPEEGGL